MMLWLLLAAWESAGIVEGYLLETRAVPGSKFEEVRVTASVPDVEPERVIAPAWGKIDDHKNNKSVVLREVLVDDGFDRKYYERISAPMISDRDYVMKTHRRDDKETRVYEITFETVQDSHPSPDGVIRAPKIRGSITVSPRDGGGSDVVYTVFCDLGGALPAWMAKGGMRSSAIEWMKDKIAKAKR